MKKVVLFLCLGAVSLSFISSKKIKNPEGFAFIPSGSTQFEGKEYSCQAFWMLDHEVTNAEYRYFLNDLKIEGKTKEYAIALPDTSAWRMNGAYNEPYENYYFRHPAYDSYPVLNVSREGVDLFLVYMTEKLRASQSYPIEDVRLPSRLEWIYAAQAGNSANVYPWGGPYLENEKGGVLANYKRIGDHNIQKSSNGKLEVVPDSVRYSGFFESGADVTAPVKSYPPNAYGLYNMSGNVAELVRENISCGGHWNSSGYDVRIASSEKFESANPFVGFRPVITFVKSE